jgi:hypothetical protein
MSPVSYEVIVYIRDGYDNKTVTSAYEPHLGASAGKTAKAIRQGRNQTCVKNPIKAR